jgi:hypothetical protein
MTCQEVAQPGPDGFTIPGIAQPIPLMPPNNCYANAKLLAEEYPGLTYQEGIQVSRISGKRITSVRHAWNIGPAGQIIDATEDTGSPLMAELFGAEVTYDYIPDGPEHDTERQAAEDELGKPDEDEEDPTFNGDQLAAERLKQAQRPGHEGGD